MKNRIKEIWIYPVKSLGGIQLDSCMAIKEGLQHDRRWMLVDEKGQFMTQRSNAQMALFSCNLKESELIVSYKGDSINVPLSDHSETLKDVHVWESSLQAHEVDPKISDWFSERLSDKVSLVKMTQASYRYKNLKVPPYKTNLSLADGYPYLILGTASMDHLNSQLDRKISANRFRANLIVESDIPHIEDTWENISIGESSMKVIKPCARCVVITIDQETAEKGKEPTKTLSTYRKEGNKILFGANAICTQEGSIAVGDVIKVY